MRLQMFKHINKRLLCSSTQARHFQCSSTQVRHFYAQEHKQDTSNAQALSKRLFKL